MSGRTGGPGRGGGLVIGLRERGGSRLRAPSLTRMAAFLPSAPHSSPPPLPLSGPTPPTICTPQLPSPPPPAWTHPSSAQRYNLIAVDLDPYGTGVG